MSNNLQDDLNIVFGGHLEEAPGVPDVAVCPGCGLATLSEEFIRRAVAAEVAPAAQQAAIERYVSGQNRYPVPGGFAAMREGSSGLCVICIHRGHMNAPGYEVQSL